MPLIITGYAVQTYLQIPEGKQEIDVKPAERKGESVVSGFDAE